MKVVHVMSKQIITAAPSARVRELWRLLFVKRINAIPVVDRERTLLGIVTQEDLLHGLYPDYHEYFVEATGVTDFEVMESKVREMGDKKASDLMNTRVIFTREHTPIMRALSRMIVRNLSQLPVLSDDDTVIGIVTKGDIFTALFKKSVRVVPKKKKKTKYG